MSTMTTGLTPQRLPATTRASTDWIRFLAGVAVASLVASLLIAVLLKHAADAGLAPDEAPSAASTATVEVAPDTSVPDAAKALAGRVDLDEEPAPTF